MFSLPTLRDNLSYQRALGVGALITTLSGDCDFDIRTLYCLLSKGIENDCIDFVFDDGMPVSFTINSDIYATYNVDCSSRCSKIFSRLSFSLEQDFYRALGNFLELLAFSDLHHRYHSADYFIKSVIPPITHQFYYIYYNKKEHPYGAVSWARLSQRKMSKLASEFVELEYEDWWSGERLFVYDLIAPWGDAASICKHLAKEVFTLDTFALADRRKACNKKKAKFTSGKMHRNLIRRDISYLKLALELDQNELIESSYFRLLNIIRQYELRMMLDSKNEVVFYDLKEIKRSSYPVMNEAKKIVDCSKVERYKLAFPAEVIRKSVDEFSAKFVEVNLCEIKFVMKPVDVIDIMNIVWDEILLCFSKDIIKDRIFFDFRDSEDKTRYSFCKYMGRDRPIYLSTAYDCSLKSALALAHEYTHAINFELTSIGNEFSIECRPVVLELIAILGEMLFIDYLMNLKFIPRKSVFEVIETNGGYIKGHYENLSESKVEQEIMASYSLNYPVSFILASEIYSIYTSDKDTAYKLISKIIYDANFDYNILLKI